MCVVKDNGLTAHPGTLRVRHSCLESMRVRVDSSFIRNSKTGQLFGMCLCCAVVSNVVLSGGEAQTFRVHLTVHCLYELPIITDQVLLGVLGAWCGVISDDKRF